MTTRTDADTILSEVADHELNVLVFFRGHWCPFCQSYLRELNGDFRTMVEAAGGRMVGITTRNIQRECCYCNITELPSQPPHTHTEGNRL